MDQARHLIRFALCAAVGMAYALEGHAAPPRSREGEIDPMVPFSYRMLGVDASCSELRRINAETGFRRFFVNGPGTEVWSEFYGADDKPLMPSLTVSANDLGGSVAVLATSLIGNRSSGLFNLRKQEMLGRLLERLSPGGVPVCARDAPGIWTLASMAEDGRSMLVSVNNLSGDVRDDVVLGFSKEWEDAEVVRIAPDGSQVSMGNTSRTWTPRLVFAQMSPEFFIVTKRH